MAAKKIDAGVNPILETLMRELDRVERELGDARDLETRLKGDRAALTERLKTEVLNLGLGRGSRLEISGIGTFGFTTERYWSVPKERRGDFARFLIKHGDIDLLTIGKSDLKAWCDDRGRIDEAVPPYVTYFENTFKPRISLEETRRRRAQKAADKASAGGGAPDS